MKKDKKTTKVSKGKIIFAWILLIILIVSALAITYIKFFGINENIEEHPVTESNKPSPVILNALQNIVDNFNNNNLLQEYKNNNITINASLEDTNIVINYEGETTITYIFSFDSPLLTTTIEKNAETSDDDTSFKIIFPMLVLANQIRLENNNEDIINYVAEFLNNNTEIAGLKKEQDNSNITYSIDISKIIKKAETNENSNSIDSNTNASTDNNNNANKDENSNSTITNNQNTNTNDNNVEE